MQYTERYRIVISAKGLDDYVIEMVDGENEAEAMRAFDRYASMQSAGTKVELQRTSVLVVATSSRA